MNQEYLNKCLLEVKSKAYQTPKNAASQRRLSRQNYSFSKQEPLKQLKIWDYIWNNSIDLWVKGQAFFYCESKIKNKDFCTFDFLIIPGCFVIKF